jgi:hypothetical protein
MSMLPQADTTAQIVLVDLDGDPIREPDASSWDTWTDNWYWGCGSCPEDPASHVHAEPPDPEETDEEWLARMAAVEESERERIETTYFPTRADLAEYDRFLSSLDDATAARCTVEEWDAIRRHQISDDELSQLAAHGCI